MGIGIYVIDAYVGPRYVYMHAERQTYTVQSGVALCLKPLYASYVYASVSMDDLVPKGRAEFQLG